MTEFKDGDKVRATYGENVLVGTLRYWRDTDMEDYFDIHIDPHTAQFAQLKRSDWTLELIKPPEPTNKEILDGLKIGTRFKYHESIGYWIKVTTDGYIYVTAAGNTSANGPFKSDDFDNEGGIVVIED